MSSDCDRIGTTIKVDYRAEKSGAEKDGAGKGGRLTSKIDSVQQKLGRKLST
jgi:uncharacterized protein YqgV (UPF0045/DUF77 family)